MGVGGGGAPNPLVQGFGGVDPKKKIWVVFLVRFWCFSTHFNVILVKESNPVQRIRVLDVQDPIYCIVMAKLI
jgi:hypothetical protein